MAKTALEVERQVRYNVTTSEGVQDLGRHKWTFLVINDLRNIALIEQRILEQLRPLEPAFTKPLYDRCAVRLAGEIYYDYFSFSSEVGMIESPDKIYRSRKLKKDRDLVPGKTEGELERYVKAVVEGKK